MAQAFKNVAIFGKPRVEGSRHSLTAALRQIAGIVESAGLQVMFDSSTVEALELQPYDGYALQAIGRQADVAVVLGGDGTMLGIARELSSFGVPLIGINHGRLGFLPAMLAGQFETDRRAMLEAEVRRRGEVIYRARAVNDVVVSRGVSGGMVEFTVRVDGVTMYNQRADGVILATPTGSTAYALSASGPILHPGLGGLVLVPVAPQTLSHRPIALPDDRVIEFELTDVREASAHFDMQSFTQLAPGDVVRARRSADVVTLLHPVGYNYFATLRGKLQWNVMPSDAHVRA
ncbi:MAG: putative inorganic polyphosphate/ATP-NAD kinase [Burkholderiaceae bacterium]|nr:putative inorganic polyphosphate/ATP-NAD kinase [Burkholderiaceae bacterium]